MSVWSFCLVLLINVSGIALYPFIMRNKSKQFRQVFVNVMLQILQTVCDYKTRIKMDLKLQHDSLH